MTTNNHPAHGPVSLDRLHQIREVLSKAAAQSDGGNLGYAMADAVKVIDKAIAAFNAELYVPTVQCWSCREVIEVSAVGDCDGYCPKCDSPIDLDEEPYDAAILQAGNSPVIPDGWISCSERMPVIGEINWRTSFPLLITCEIGVIPAYYGFVSVNGDRHYGFMESLKYGDDNGNHPQTNEYGLISNVTHWMPLPEPPQEVNRG
ncbi:TPA: DUF551 domain-containing protein [Escherichia coli]|uniref:DUF551 domain-containing protein n=1 Tax=Escherichia coli TaxID=562 RepID=UPI00203AF07B|nr:DUF551 domain-containing protein [Escherichia coli]